MNDAGVAKRYAQALFMLADESQNVDKIGQDLAYACETIDGNAELKQAYTGVQFSMAGKKKRDRKGLPGSGRQDRRKFPAGFDRKRAHRLSFRYPEGLRKAFG